jgi:hypothetical protein
MAYDAATKTVILFAGFHGTGYWDDTWSWNGTTWTQLSPAHSPGIDAVARQAAYDTASNQLLLFGGDAGHNTFLNTIWTWTGTDWTQLSPATSPPPRAYGAMTFDSATGQVVLFSGSENALKSFPTTTWAWSGSTWSQI